MSEYPGYAEYGLLCSRWAINYFQGRRGTLRPEDLQRPRSELIVVIISDENEDLTSDSGSELDTASKAEMLTFLGVNSWSQVNGNVVGAKFIEYFHSVASSPPYGAATPFLVYNKNSSYEREGYFEFMDKDPTAFPNGASMDIEVEAQIPEFVQKIIRAATGLASSFEPSSTPVTANMRCVVQRAFSTDSIELEHSLQNGWNYDPVAHSMVFYGEDRPRLLDSFAIAYMYWVSND
jgi:hypothetical protein